MILNRRTYILASIATAVLPIATSSETVPLAIAPTGRGKGVGFVVLSENPS